ncbi:hypothetical protein pb186bvf_014277 [Paramecium bursaria]
MESLWHQKRCIWSIDYFFYYKDYLLLMAEVNHYHYYYVLLLDGWKQNKRKEEQFMLLKVQKKLSKTDYRQKISILASRAKLYINEGSNKKANINKECRRLTNKNLSTFYNEAQIKWQPSAKDLNIEDLSNYTASIIAYVSIIEKDIEKIAQMILMTYNYLLLRDRRWTFFSLSQQTIIIVMKDLYKWIEKVQELGQLSSYYKDPAQLKRISYNVDKFLNHFGQTGEQRRVLMQKYLQQYSLLRYLLQRQINFLIQINNYLNLRVHFKIQLIKMKKLLKIQKKDLSSILFKTFQVQLDISNISSYMQQNIELIREMIHIQKQQTLNLSFRIIFQLVMQKLTMELYNNVRNLGQKIDEFRGTQGKFLYVQYISLFK